MSAFRILVVDDSPVASRFIELAVGSQSVQVVGAADGHAALVHVDNDRLDVAFVATAFAGAANHELVAALFARNVPVVLMTGTLDQSGVDTEIATAGVIAKPLQAGRLRALIAGLMRPEPVSDAVEREDPIESWLSGVDETLGFAGKPLRSYEDEARAMAEFQRDVAALRGRSRPQLSINPSQHA